MSAIDSILERNKAYAAERAAELGAAPRMRVTVVTCMDAGIETRAVFGLQPGDMHVLRNAGGIVTDDMLRSISISQSVLGTREVMIVKHTQCGMSMLTEDELRSRIENATGHTPEGPLGTFDEIDEAVRASVKAVRESRLVPYRDNVRGFVYDVATGLLREVG